MGKGGREVVGFAAEGDDGGEDIAIIRVRQFLAALDRLPFPFKSGFGIMV